MRWLTLLLVAALAACGPAEEPRPRASQPAAERLERQKVSQDRQLEAPTMITHRTAAGELLVVGVATGGNDRAVDRQNCFIWRDAEFKTATMSCPSDQQDTVVDAPGSTWPGRPAP